MFYEDDEINYEDLGIIEIDDEDDLSPNDEEVIIKNLNNKKAND